MKGATTYVNVFEVMCGVWRLKSLVGGYPFIVDDKLWQTIGADGYAINAREVVKVAEKLIVKE